MRRFCGDNILMSLYHYKTSKWPIEGEGMEANTCLTKTQIMVISSDLWSPKPRNRFHNSTCDKKRRAPGLKGQPPAMARVGFHLMLQHLFAFSLMLIAQLVWFGMLDVKKVKNTDKRRNLEATFSAYLSLQLPSMAHYRENMVAQNTAGHQLYKTVYTNTIYHILYTPTIQQSAYFWYWGQFSTFLRGPWSIKTREVLGNPFLMPMTVGSFSHAYKPLKLAIYLVFANHHVR